MKNRALIYLLLANLPIILMVAFFGLTQDHPAMAAALDAQPQTMAGGRTYPTPTRTPVPTATPEPRTYPEPTAYPMATPVGPISQPVSEMDVPVAPGAPVQVQVPIPSMPGANMTIDLPSGVVDQNAILKIINPEMPMYQQPRSSFFEIFGQAVDIKLYDSNGNPLTLNKPIIITVTYPEEREAELLQNLSFWRIYWTHDGVHWEQLDTIINTRLNTLSASVNHLTIFAPINLRFGLRLPLVGRGR